MTRHLSSFALPLTAVFVLACSGNSPPQPAPPGETAEQPAAKDHSDLASCMDGAAVPADATNCRLDLGTGVDTYWLDSDGVDPGTAGCHDEYNEATCETVKNGRMFGELCLDDDRLVESNPGAGECHTHGADLGHPEVVSCSAWCKSTKDSAGRCEGNVSAQGVAGTCVSARCVCDA